MAELIRSSSLIKVKVIWAAEINVAGIRRQPEEVFETEKTPEITKLIYHKYLAKVEG